MAVSLVIVLLSVAVWTAFICSLSSNPPKLEPLTTWPLTTSPLTTGPLTTCPLATGPFDLAHSLQNSLKLHTFRSAYKADWMEQGRRHLLPSKNCTLLFSRMHWSDDSVSWPSVVCLVSAGYQNRKFEDEVALRQALSAQRIDKRICRLLRL